MLSACAKAGGSARGATPAIRTTAARSATATFDRIDYAHPERYLELKASLGDRGAIERIAASLQGDSDEEKLRAIYTWMSENVRYNKDDARDGRYHWRNFDQLVSDKTHGGCADQSILFGALARAKGIPAVWVKTMDVDWIQEFERTKGAVSSWRGHVFSEIFIDGRWRLLDETRLKIYDNYDPHSRILPGPRFAYDKGDDPFELVLSSRYELWKEQTSAYFSRFDRS